MNHLEYYKECLETGYLKGRLDSYRNHYRNGLCYEKDIDKKLLALFTPTEADCLKYYVDAEAYWASDVKGPTEDSEFGPTRQNIVLFIAAMKGEL